MVDEFDFNLRALAEHAGKSCFRASERVGNRHYATFVLTMLNDVLPWYLKRMALGPKP